LGNNSANDTHTIRCRSFFIKLLTDESDLVLDIFAGSNTTGATAEKLARRWLAMELSEEYLDASKFRFDLGRRD
jgi:DNA modification methylase